MPLYQVEHACELSSLQQDQLAQAFTKIHSTKFTTPSLFVNVTFTDVSSQAAYVAGKRRSTNRLLAHVRTGPSRTTEDYNSLTSSLVHAWTDIVGNTGKQELRVVFVLGDVVAGAEAGFAFPAAGKDKEWLKEHYEEFEQKAQLGDEDFQDLMHELRERQDLKEVLDEA